MRILHLADLHLGVENYGRIDAATGLHSRFNDYLARLDAALALALDAGVDLVLIAGDIYKNRTPNPTHQREFARRIYRLRSAGVPVFILTGNHDISPALGRAHSVEIFAALGVEGVTIADRPRLHQIETPAGIIQIIALPWVTRHSLMTREEMRGANFASIEYEVRRRLEAFVVDAAQRLDPAYPALIAFHGSLDGAQLGAERSMTLGQDLVLPRSLMAQPGVAYVAMGHIHKHQALSHDPPMVYPGSIERVDFGERDEPKGCVMVEITGGRATWQFHALPARPFVSIEKDVRASSDPLEQVRILIGRHDLHEAVVRVELRAEREQVPNLREERIRELLEAAGAFYIAAINVHVERSGRRRLAGMEQELLDGLTPRRALELYLNSKQPPLAPERINALLSATDELLT
ncbi:metallophosphoesterase family protein [Candidatus Viridilinea mediisalina]|uniref:Nuclease SbcCD subunit D n=1 Tax=Candidatus Viridilinea mediisalina TaxID=2024553 RepID=A0A2A6RPU9_9CHLR|nr:exonuclease SbcCD subunit D [Candidatus Viridilinea mediisalina]PDW04899.1 exonuclease sbcCD subunit D [Candidatus Viridilinea mediisalina]